MSVTAVISVDHKQCKIMKKISIGIDFSKKTFDSTVMRRENDSFLELGYCRFNNDKKGFKAFEKWVRSLLGSTPEAKDKSSWIFCGEHTGTCSTGLCDYLTEKGYFVWLESALVIHRKCGIVREKNDRVDSRRIAGYALRNFSTDVRPYTLDSKDLKKLKSLYAAHDMLTRDKVAKINQLKSGTLDACPQAKALMEKHLAGIEKSLKEIDRQIEYLLKESEEFKRSYTILRSFKGVGKIAIAVLVIKTRNFKDMTDPRELGCYIGVVPHRKQSGTSMDRPARTSRYRDRAGNSIITTCATIAIRYNNPAIRPYYDRLISRGVNPNKAKNNCKFKIINILLAMIRNDTEFDMEKYGKDGKKWNAA